MSFSKKEIFNWTNLSVLGKNKFIKSFYIYLLLIPIVAKLLSKAEDTITILGISFDLVLPFSWKMFFFSALLFTIGNLLYSFYSPRIIFENENFHDFQIKKFELLHLIKYARNMKLMLSDYNYQLQLHTRKFRYGILHQVRKGVWEEFHSIEGDLKDEVYSEIFYFLYEYTINYRKTLVFIISLFYAAGIILFLLAFIPQLFYVMGEL